MITTTARRMGPLQGSNQQRECHANSQNAKKFASAVLNGFGRPEMAS